MIKTISGNTDIQNGNVKLILGLIWSLIAHYQLGASNFPPKKLMLAWLKVRIKIFETASNEIVNRLKFIGKLMVISKDHLLPLTH